MNTQLFNFYTGKGTDSEGRSIADMLAFDDDQMESEHSFIQWLFPTATPSRFNRDCPILDSNTLMSLRTNVAFNDNYQKALKKILDFWKIPFVHVPGARNLEVGQIKRVSNWMAYGDHNQLRIARVLESARLLGYENTAQSLFLALMKFCAQNPLAGELTATNVAYWYQAASGNKIA